MKTSNAKRQIKKKKLTHSQLESRLWDIFSKYIRLKHAVLIDGIYMNQCVTCDAMKETNGGMQAGHYISRTVKSIKYDEQNVHGQCPACNNPRIGGGRPTLYRMAIVATYGENTAKRLDNELVKHRSGKTKRFSMFELETLYNTYKKKLTELAKIKGDPWRKT